MSTETLSQQTGKENLKKKLEIQIELINRQRIAHNNEAEANWIKTNAAKFSELLKNHPEFLEEYNQVDSFQKEQVLSQIEEELYASK